MIAFIVAAGYLRWEFEKRKRSKANVLEPQIPIPGANLRINSHGGPKLPPQPIQPDEPSKLPEHGMLPPRGSVSGRRASHLILQRPLQSRMAGGRPQHPTVPREDTWDELDGLSR